MRVIVPGGGVVDSVVLTEADILSDLDTPDVDLHSQLKAGSALSIDADGWIEFDLEDASSAALQTDPFDSVGWLFTLRHPDLTAIDGVTSWMDYDIEWYVEVDAQLQQYLSVCAGFSAGNSNPLQSNGGAKLGCGLASDTGTDNAGIGFVARGAFNEVLATGTAGSRVCELRPGRNESVLNYEGYRGSGIIVRETIDGPMVGGDGYAADTNLVPGAADMLVGWLCATQRAAHAAGDPHARFRLQYKLQPASTRGSRGWRT